MDLEEASSIYFGFEVQHLFYEASDLHEILGQLNYFLKLIFTRLLKWAVKFQLQSQQRLADGESLHKNVFQLRLWFV